MIGKIHGKTACIVAVIALALMVPMIALSGSAGVASAAGNVSELHNSTYAVDNSTTEAYVDILNTNNTSVTVKMFGIDSAGNLTEVHNVSVIADANVTVTETVVVNSTAYDEYRIVVIGEEAELIESGLIGRLSGGGGAFVFTGNFADWTVFGLPAWVVALLGVGAYVYRKEQIENGA